MPILPNNTDPSKEYVTQSVNPPLTIDGVVYNKIYSHTGVIDTLSNIQSTGYSDPNVNIFNQSNSIISFDPQLQKSWISSTDFGGPTSKPVVITYDIVNTTYYNNIVFDVLNVPCFVEILDENDNPLPGSSTFSIAGGGDIYTTTNWLRLEYNAPTNPTPATVSGTNGTSNFTYPLTGVSEISIRITRNKTVQSNSGNGNTLTNIAYSVGVQNFSIKLIVKNNSDIPAAVVSGSNSIITQNRFNFVETYSYSVNSVSNMFVNDSTYWKCAPQPVKDSIVYFYMKVSDPTPKTINRLYIDPLYSGCKFNVYYTIQSTVSGTVDPSTFSWTPIQRDFSLRKGLYDLPTVSCTYLKIEFIKLIPEVYDLPLDSINKTINVFPYDVENYFSQLEANIIDGNAVKYAITNPGAIGVSTILNQQISNSTILGNATANIGNNSTFPSLANLNSTQINNPTTQSINTSSYIIDPSISYKLLDSNGNYNYSSYNEFLQRRFPDNRVHVYNQVNINQTWHQAYFTGIRYITSFFENNFDDLRGTPQNFIASNGSNTGFSSQGVDYINLNVDEIAVTPWFSTIDSFNAFNIGGLTTDWQSFLTQGNTISNDNTLMNNINAATLSTMLINASGTKIGTLGTSTIYAISGQPNTQYGIQSAAYSFGNNILNYYNANFLPYSGSILNWSGLGGTTITGTSVNYYNPSTGLSGTASGLSVSGGNYTAAFNFTIPNVNASGIQTWQLQFGAPSFGVVGYASYTQASGFNYYFLTNVQASGSTNISLKTRFINPTTNNVISGTTVSGSTVAVTSGFNIATVTGTNYSTSIPSNTIQLVISGSASVPYSLYQLGVFTQPTNKWIGPSDHSNMRVSGTVRVLLPKNNAGTYRASLIGTDVLGNLSELAYKIYTPGTMPINTWFDVELEGFTGSNYVSFVMVIRQIVPTINEIFYVSMLAPFYHPVRYEFTNTQNNNITGKTGWYPITLGVNDANSFISTASGLPASGIQIRMTALDPNVYVTGVSIIPQYKQNSYYSNLDINYIGVSKTNEISSRRNISSKPYFQLNSEYHPAIFNINRISSNVNLYNVD